MDKRAAQEINENIIDVIVAYQLNNPGSEYKTDLVEIMTLPYFQQLINDDKDYDPKKYDSFMRIVVATCDVLAGLQKLDPETYNTLSGDVVRDVHDLLKHIGAMNMAGTEILVCKFDGGEQQEVPPPPGKWLEYNLATGTFQVYKYDDEGNINLGYVELDPNTELPTFTAGE